MTVYEVKYKVVAPGEKEVVKKVTVSLPSNAGEITLLQWVKYTDLYESSAPKELFEDTTTMTPEGWIEFVQYSVKVLEVFTGKDLSDLVYAIKADALIAMMVQVVNVVSQYQPHERNSFVWKGEKFLIPETIFQSFGQSLVGGDMTVQEAIDALQIEHVFGAKNKEGKPVVEDAKYHNDIALVATLARKVLPDGSVEVPPMEFLQRRRWFDNRIAFFQDLSMDVALDVAFFLIGSKSAYRRILKLAWHLNRLSLVQKPEGS